MRARSISSWPVSLAEAPLERFSSTWISRRSACARARPSEEALKPMVVGIESGRDLALMRSAADSAW